MSMRALVMVLGVVAGLAACPVPPLATVDARAQPERATDYRARPAARGERMVVTAHELATRAALEMLDTGGSAVDAAIAAQWVLGLVEPQSSGPAGGGFLLYFDATSGQLRFFDGRAATRCRSGMPQQAGCRSACRACRRCWKSRIGPAAACLGRACSSRPFGSRARATPCHRDCMPCWPPSRLSLPSRACVPSFFRMTGKCGRWAPCSRITTTRG